MYPPPQKSVFFQLFGLFCFVFFTIFGSPKTQNRPARSPRQYVMPKQPKVKISQKAPLIYKGSCQKSPISD